VRQAICGSLKPVPSFPLLRKLTKRLACWHTGGMSFTSLFRRVRPRFLPRPKFTPPMPPTPSEALKRQRGKKAYRYAFQGADDLGAPRAPRRRRFVPFAPRRRPAPPRPPAHPGLRRGVPMAPQRNAMWSRGFRGADESLGASDSPAMTYSIVAMAVVAGIGIWAMSRD
jgi:hypothetical protein